jgi:NAD(P)-dependent dehydrogenase (short-subunit alcohol dehydrogenase family)
MTLADFAGTVSLVTGASRGIGLACVERLVERQGAVLAVSRGRSDELDRLATSGRVQHARLDLCETGAAERACDEAVSRFGRLDHLVNNVGAVLDARPDGTASISDEQWLASLTINLMTAVRCCRAARPHLLRTRGAVVNVSTVAALTPAPSVTDYAVSKAALNCFGKALSEELGPHGVRVNTVSPGTIRTPLWLADGGLADKMAAVGGGTRDEVLRQVERDMNAALGRLGEADEVADAIVFLLSRDARWITGGNLLVDGGTFKAV